MPQAKPPKLNLEIEVKLAVPNGLAAMRRAIKALNFKPVTGRVFELNVLFDTLDLQLRRKGEMIRIRRVRKLSILTFKGPSIPGPHKSREELESEITNPDTMELILARLGLHPVFRYEKFREEYMRTGQRGTITLDQTPIGNFVELEGKPRWIDKTARELGFSAAAYITKSYGNLYLAHCREHGLSRSAMVFIRDKALND
ncbi:MAG: class IV adenylate cyclase [Acidobacteriota bacterium]|nr:class IV adenylate cyclase [Acidobacteriota bacterium]